MKKNFLQDVIPPNHKRSIRDIPLPQQRSTKARSAQPHEVHKPATPKVAPEPVHKAPETPRPEVFHDAEDKEPVFNPQQFHTPDYAQDPDHNEVYKQPLTAGSNFSNKQPPKGGMLSKLIILVLVVAIATGAFLISQTQATVIAYPKQSSQNINVSVSTDSPLTTMTQVTQTASVNLVASSEQQVEQQASGRIKITNRHSEAPQDLVKNTRFQTAEGLVYRIKESIQVPGVKNGTPGTFEVVVYADSAGEEYNIAKTTFTIPGFSGMEQFTTITAESVTDMTGGYIGIKKVASEADRDTAQAKLKADLAAKFTADAQITDTHITVSDLESISYGEILDTVSGETILLSMTATANAYSFQKQALMDYIGQNVIVGATSDNSFTIDPSALAFTLQDDRINVIGSTQIKWITDIEALKVAISGKKKSEVADIVNSYESLQKTDVVLKPFWKSKFPVDTNKIKVQIAG